MSLKKPRIRVGASKDLDAFPLSKSCKGGQSQTRKQPKSKHTPTFLQALTTPEQLPCPLCCKHSSKKWARNR
eukprot:scaffold195690_cov18-Tisochrysis_lutea.AAC.1